MPRAVANSRVRVWDLEDGKPLAGVAIAAVHAGLRVPLNGPLATTDDSGWGTLPGALQTEQDLLISKSGYLPEIIEQPSGSTEAEVGLSRALSLEVAVADERGAPLQGVTVVACYFAMQALDAMDPPLIPTLVAGRPSFSSAVSGVDGVARLTGLVEGDVTVTAIDNHRIALSQPNTHVPGPRIGVSLAMPLIASWGFDNPESVASRSFRIKGTALRKEAQPRSLREFVAKHPLAHTVAFIEAGDRDVEILASMVDGSLLHHLITAVPLNQAQEPTTVVVPKLLENRCGTVIFECPELPGGVSDLSVTATSTASSYAELRDYSTAQVMRTSPWSCVVPLGVAVRMPPGEFRVEQAVGFLASTNVKVAASTTNRFRLDINRKVTFCNFRLGGGTPRGLAPSLVFAGPSGRGMITMRDHDVWMPLREGVFKIEISAFGCESVSRVLQITAEDLGGTRCELFDITPRR